MAKGINKVIAVGHLGADPETRFLPSGVAVATFSIAATEQWVDKQTGEKQERTEWIRCEVWGKTAEACAQYLSKGSLVYIEGRMRTDKWEDKNSGVTKYSTKVRADSVQFLSATQGSGQQQRAPQQQNQQPAPMPDSQDIPF